MVKKKEKLTKNRNEAKKLPVDLRKKAAAFLPGLLGHRWPVEYVGEEIPGGMKPSQWDFFHELILFGKKVLF
jgi:hypothetical protein